MNWVTTPSVLPVIHDVVVGVTPMPYNLLNNYQLAKTPNCAQDPTYTKSCTPPLKSAWHAQTDSGDGESGTISVTAVTLTDVGVYDCTLTASLTALKNGGTTVTINTPYTVEIHDPCKTAIWELTPDPVIDMVIVMPSAGPTTQTIKIWTDVERTYAIECPITGVLTADDGNTYPWISWTEPNIKIDHTKII
jgi:hypothetical protein